MKEENKEIENFQTLFGWNKRYYYFKNWEMSSSKKQCETLEADNFMSTKLYLKAKSILTDKNLIRDKSISKHWVIYAELIPL